MTDIQRVALSPDLQREADRIVTYMRDVRIPAIIAHQNRCYAQRNRRNKERQERNSQYERLRLIARKYLR